MELVANNPEKRCEQWQSKRIFFCTPQILDNDIARGACPCSRCADY